MKEKCEESRSQHRNKELAMERLLARIENRIKGERLKKLNDTRNKTVSEAGRIRTYNEQRGEVTDHRTGKTAKYDDVLNKGKIDLLK
jgi:peptide chain release factor 1